MSSVSAFFSQPPILMTSFSSKNGLRRNNGLLFFNGVDFFKQFISSYHTFDCTNNLTMAVVAFSSSLYCKISISFLELTLALSLKRKQ